MNGGVLPSSWPTQIEYQEAFAAPDLYLADPVLRKARVTRTAFGLPQPISGQFANVYHMSVPDDYNGTTEYAVRVFLRDRPGRDTHYQAIAAHLASLPTYPPFLALFHYQPQGILVRGTWFPVQKMSWVSGTPLNLWVEENLYNAVAIRGVAENLRAVISDMRAARFAHGDLQHGNILIESDGAIRLIDYDGAWVPARAGYPLREAGHPAYQHPRRTVADYNFRMDDCPALALYATLRVLAVVPEIWYQLDNGDNMLFRIDDFRNTVESRGFRTLRAALRRFPTELQLIERVAEAADGALTLIPSLDRI